MLCGDISTHLNRGPHSMEAQRAVLMLPTARATDPDPTGARCGAQFSPAKLGQDRIDRLKVLTVHSNHRHTLQLTPLSPEQAATREVVSTTTEIHMACSPSN